MGIAGEAHAVVERRILDPRLIKGWDMHHILASAVADPIGSTPEIGAARAPAAFRGRSNHPTNFVDRAGQLDAAESDEAIRLGQQRGRGAGGRE